MANPLRGEASFTHGGRTYQLRLSLHAWAVAQDALTKNGQVPSFDEISDRVRQESILHVIAIFYGMLQEKHPEIQTMQQASEILQASEGVGAMAFAKAFGLQRPDPKDVQELKEAEAKADPLKAHPKRSGTGAVPISKRAASA